MPVGHPLQADDRYGFTLRSMIADALREFFAHERDVELGRWRSKKHPAWTAVLAAHVDMVNFRHDNGVQAFEVDNRERRYSQWSIELQDVAAEYFAAHPEPKPWHDAKPGEVWVVSAYEEPIAMTVFESDFGGLLFRQNDREGTTWAIDTPVITSARRIFPEVSDD